MLRKATQEEEKLDISLGISYLNLKLIAQLSWTMSKLMNYSNTKTVKTSVCRVSGERSKNNQQLGGKTTIFASFNFFLREIRMIFEYSVDMHAEYQYLWTWQLARSLTQLNQYKRTEMKCETIHRH